MPRTHGPWTINATTEIYANRFLRLEEDQVIQPDGTPGTYATLTLKAGVAVLPCDADGTVYLVRQFRYALGRTSLEVVSGTVDGGEEPLRAAQREAGEELGIEADEWIGLGRIDPDTAIVRCPVALFLARCLRFGQPRREGSEVMEPIKLPFNEALDQVLDGAITHGPSCALILKTAALRHQAG